jgi:hypothetical protein
MPRSQLRARFLLSDKSGTDAPRREAAGSDLPPGQASRSCSQAEISRGACCASHVTHPSTPGGVVKGSCAGVPGPLGPDSVWEQPRLQIGSHRPTGPVRRKETIPVWPRGRLKLQGGKHIERLATLQSDPQGPLVRIQLVKLRWPRDVAVDTGPWTR